MANQSTMKMRFTVFMMLAWLVSCSAMSEEKTGGVAAMESTPANSSATVQDKETTAKDQRFSMIVVLKDFKSLLTVQTMCTKSKWIWFFSSRRLGIPQECHMPHICRRIYSTALFGFAGEFSNEEMTRLHRCIPGSVYYKELDGKVRKLEDQSMARWTSKTIHMNDDDTARRRQQRRRLRDDSDGDVGNDETNGNGNETIGSVRTDTVIGMGNVRSYAVVNKTQGSSQMSEGLNILDITGGKGPNAFVEPGIKVQMLPDDGNLWHLDRVEKRNLPLNGEYHYGDEKNIGTGSGVTIYVIDSGIKKDHQEFRYGDGSSGSRASYGYDFVEDDEEPDDCDGHGTHVAATAIGLQVGIAKNAKMVSLRILDCVGSGTISDTVAALDWVAANAKKPAVVILSLGIQVGSWSRVLEEATRSLVRQHGITVVVASGNSAMDACYVAPANVPEVITVAASDVENKYEETKAGEKEGMYRWSNTGPCVDLFAPGVDIFSACGSFSRCEDVTPHSYTYASGTSMAVPSVAGVAALFLEEKPHATPEEVSQAVIDGTTIGKIASSEFMTGTANRLLFSRITNQGQDVMAANGP